MAEGEGAQPAGEPVLAGKVVVVVEVVDRLVAPQIQIVDVAYFSGPLEVEVGRVDVGVLVPPVAEQLLPEVCVAALDDEDFLVGRDAVVSLPHLDVHWRLGPALLLLLLLLLVALRILCCLGLPFRWAGSDVGNLGLVLDGAQLLAGDVVVLLPAPVLALAVQQLLQLLLELAGFHGVGQQLLLAFERAQEVLLAVEQAV